MSYAPSDSIGFRLRTRILASTTAVLVLAMTAAFLWSAVNLRQVLDLHNDQFLNRILAELISMLHDEHAGPEGEEMIAELQRESHAHSDSGLFAIVRNKNGVRYYPDNEITRTADAVLQGRDPDRNELQTTFTCDKTRVRVIRSNAETTSDNIWTIDLGLTLTETDATTRAFNRRLAFGGVVFVMASFAGGLFLTRVALRPIARCIAASRKLNPEDLSARLPLSGTGDELDQLAATFNELLDRIARTHHQMIRFTSDASHELRSPLAALRSAIEIALQQPRTNDNYRELLGFLGEQCQRLTDLVNTLLLLARADAGQIGLKIAPIDLALLIHEIIELFQPLLEERQLTLDTQIPDHLIVNGDRLRLGQLVTNLLDNAIKFTNEGGRIAIALQPTGSGTELVVSDTGIGISPDRLPRIFDRFYRGDESRSGGGTGLGLSICHWIVTASAGTIQVSSAEGAGTTFRIQLPS